MQLEVMVKASGFIQLPSAQKHNQLLRKKGPRDLLSSLDLNSRVHLVTGMNNDALIDLKAVLNFRFHAVVISY